MAATECRIWVSVKEKKEKVKRFTDIYLKLKQLM